MQKIKEHIKKDLRWLKTPMIRKEMLAIFLLVVLAAAVIPLLVLSFYSRPFGDDFTFGIQTAVAWRHTHNLWEVFLASFKTIDIFYQWWQGTFTAVFLFTLQPGIFGEKLYFLTTFILMGSLFFSIAYLLHAVIVKLLKGDIWSFVLVTTVILLLAVVYVPDANSAFYFYNGGIYYTFYFSLMLILLGLLIRFDLSKKKTGKVLRAIGVIFLAGFIGGGNYATALFTVLILAFYGLYVSIKKKKWHWLSSVAFLFSLGVLIASMVAPGNAYRAATVTTNKTAFMAIMSSLVGGVSYFEEWTTLVVIALLVLITPFMKPVLAKSTLRFRHPLLVAFISFLFFCSQFAPTQYALGDFGPSRLVNIYYFSFLLVIALIYFYSVGYFVKNIAREKTDMETSQVRLSPSFAFIAFGLLALGVFVRPVAELNNLPTISALHSLFNGEAQTYAAEMDARFAVLNDPNVENAVFGLLSVHPALFNYELAGSNPAAYPNHDMALFYEKVSIIISDLG